MTQKQILAFRSIISFLGIILRSKLCLLLITNFINKPLTYYLQFLVGLTSTVSLRILSIEIFIHQSFYIINDNQSFIKVHSCINIGGTTSVKIGNQQRNVFLHFSLSWCQEDYWIHFLAASFIITEFIILEEFCTPS